MPDWVHAIVTLRGWWLPGDPRGFRSRDHRIHSSGDYRNPPPKGEHTGLYALNRARSTKAPELTPAERESVAEVFIERLTPAPWSLLALACGAGHLHALFRAPGTDAARILGQCKRIASYRLERNAGRLWGRGAGIDRIASADHWRAVERYILAHRREGAVVWSARRRTSDTDP